MKTDLQSTDIHSGVAHRASHGDCPSVRVSMDRTDGQKVVRLYTRTSLSHMKEWGPDALRTAEPPSHAR